VIIGTPIDLRRVLRINKPSVRVRYDLAEITKPGLSEILTRFLAGAAKKKEALHEA
jgi:predicted GTPase